MKLNLKGVKNSEAIKDLVKAFLKANGCIECEELKVYPETRERYLLRLGDNKITIDIRDNEDLQSQKILGNLCS